MRMDFRTLKLTYDTRKWLEKKDITTVEKLTSLTFNEFMFLASYLGEQRIIEIVGKLAFNDLYFEDCESEDSRWLYKKYIEDYYTLKATKVDGRKLRYQDC